MGKKRATAISVEAESLEAWSQRHLEWMRMRGYSERTVVGREPWLMAFARWCEARGIERPADVTRPVLERYQRHLYLHRKTNGRPLSFGSQVTRLVPVRSLFRWLMREGVLLSNPASELELPKKERRLPRAVLTPEEAERVLAMPRLDEPLGLRDRAILEVLYSTGMRRMELVALLVYDVDGERGTARIREGKGKKERLVPIGERALAWVERYLAEVRPEHAVGRDEGVLFLSHLGEPLDAAYLTHRVREYVDAAELGKKGACHMFRHTMATAMLEGGADVRFVQEMLGHAKLDTTQLYTHVSIKKLQAVHAATHPAARLRRVASSRARGAAATDEKTGDAGDEAAELEGRDEVDVHTLLAAEAAEEVD